MRSRDKDAALQGASWGSHCVVHRAWGVVDRDFGTSAATDELCRKIWFHLRSMTRLDFGDLLGYFIERQKNVRHANEKRVASAGHRRIPSSGFAAPASQRAPYYGRAVLVRRGLRAMSRHLGWKLGQGGVIVGKFYVVGGQCGHGDMFDKPEV